MLKKIEKSVRRLGDTGWISALQLTMWDNIFGPRVEIVRLLLEITGNALLINTQIWHGCEEIEEEVQLKTARHSLSGELGEEETMASLIETKFHVFSELGKNSIPLQILKIIFESSHIRLHNDCASLHGTIQRERHKIFFLFFGPNPTHLSVLAATFHHRGSNVSTRPQTEDFFKQGKEESGALFCVPPNSLVYSSRIQLRYPVSTSCYPILLIAPIPSTDLSSRRSSSNEPSFVTQAATHPSSWPSNFVFLFIFSLFSSFSQHPLFLPPPFPSKTYPEL